jgi:hypothetical protein
MLIKKRKKNHLGSENINVTRCLLLYDIYWNVLSLTSREEKERIIKDKVSTALRLRRLGEQWIQAVNKPHTHTMLPVNVFVLHYYIWIDTQYLRQNWGGLRKSNSRGELIKVYYVHVQNYHNKTSLYN